MKTTTEKPPLTLYVVTGKRKPVKTDRTMDRDKVWPPTVKHTGTTYYFTNADLVLNTITYVNVNPHWSSET